MSIDLYFDTLSAALDACETRLTVARAVPHNPAWRSEMASHMTYNSTAQYCVPLAEWHGRPTNRHFQIALYRMDSGNYELTTYFL
jgi:hypothetical protein